MHRATILYRTTPGCRFDWTYYRNNHLPLALGATLRHFKVVRCDLDRPLAATADAGAGEPEYQCICTVYFESGEELAGFMAFFGEGGAEARAILADGPNYSDITPLFMPGQAFEYDLGAQGRAEPMAAPAEAGDRFRLRFFYPAGGDTHFDHDYYAATHLPLAMEALDAGGPVARVEVDHVMAAAGADGAAPFHCICSFYFPTREAIERYMANMGGDAAEQARADIVNYTNAKPHLLASQVEIYDLGRAQ